MVRQDSPVDRLVAESEQLRADLLRATTRIATFSEALQVAVAALQAEAADAEEEGDGERGDQA